MYEHIDRQTGPLHVGSQYIARAVSRVGAAQGRLLPLLPCPIIPQRTAPQPNISVSTWPYLLQPSLRPFARRRCVCQALLCFCGVSLATNRRRRKRVRPTSTRSRTRDNLRLSEGTVTCNNRWTASPVVHTTLPARDRRRLRIPILSLYLARTCLWSPAYLVVQTSLACHPNDVGREALHPSYCITRSYGP